MSTRRQIVRAACLVPLLAAGLGAQAADPAWPERNVTIIVPFAAGGPTDVLTRIVAARLQQQWGQSVIVDYKPGAGTMLGSAAVAKAPADGYTLLVTTPAYMINPVIRTQMPYDPKDLTGITQLVKMPIAIAANPAVPFNTLPELVAYAKGHPGKVTFATPGAGGTSHLAGELLKRMAGIEMMHVPYKGSAPAHTDVIGGRVDLMIDPIFSVMPHVRAGKMKLIAVASEERVRGFEQYAPVAEQYPGFDVNAVVGLAAPAATPPAVIEKIQRDVATALAIPEDRARIEKLGMEVVGSTAPEFNKVLAGETAKWGRLIREAKIPMLE